MRRMQKEPLNFYCDRLDGLYEMNMGKTSLMCADNAKCFIYREERGCGHD